MLNQRPEHSLDAWWRVPFFFFPFYIARLLALTLTCNWPMIESGLLIGVPISSGDAEYIGKRCMWPKIPRWRKEPTCQCRRFRRRWFDPWVRKILWRRKWQPALVFLPGESPWTKEPGWLQSTGSQRIRHDWNAWTRIHTCMWPTALPRLLSDADWFLICGLEPFQRKMFTTCFYAQLNLLITWVAQQRKPSLLSVSCSLLFLDSQKLLKVSKIKTSGSWGLFHQRPYNSNEGYHEEGGFHFSDSCAPKIPHVKYRPGETCLSTWRNTKGSIHSIINMLSKYLFSISDTVEMIQRRVSHGFCAWNYSQRQQMV